MHGENILKTDVYSIYQFILLIKSLLKKYQLVQNYINNNI